MKVYKSRIDWYFKGILLVVAAILGFTSISLFSDDRESTLSKFFYLFVIAILVLVLGHIIKNTFYRIEDKILHVQSSVFKKRINIHEITEIRKNKTLFIGFKLALAAHGLVIHYKKHEVIYISPENEAELINELLKKNNSIKIID